MAFSHFDPMLVAGPGDYELGGVAISVKEVTHHLQSAVKIVLEGTNDAVLALLRHACRDYALAPHLKHPRKVMEFRFAGDWVSTGSFPTEPFNPDRYPPRIARQVERFLEVTDTGRVLGIYGPSGSGRKRLVRSIALTLDTHLKAVDHSAMSGNIQKMVDAMPRAALLLEDFDSIAEDTGLLTSLSTFKRMFLNREGHTLFVISKTAEALKSIPTFDQVRLDLHRINEPDFAKYREYFIDSEAGKLFFEPVLGKSIPQHLLDNFMRREFNPRDVQDSQKRLERVCSAWAAGIGHTMYT